MVIRDSTKNEIAFQLVDKTNGDGITILEIASLALTDINFHPESKVLAQMAELIENNYTASLKELARMHLDD